MNSFHFQQRLKLLKTKLSILPISANPGSNGLNIFNPSSLTTNSFGHFKKLQKSSRAHVHPFPGDTFISLISGESHVRMSDRTSESIGKYSNMKKWDISNKNHVTSFQTEK